MKNFDIELAKQGHPVCTRDGRPVKILDFDFNHNVYSIVAKICFKEYDVLQTYTKEGLFVSSIKTSEYDLFMASEKKEGWINIYPKRPKGSKKREAGACIYPTEKDAKTASCNNCVATIKIEWEE